MDERWVRPRPRRISNVYNNNNNNKTQHKQTRHGNVSLARPFSLPAFAAAPSRKIAFVVNAGAKISFPFFRCALLRLLLLHKIDFLAYLRRRRRRRRKSFLREALLSSSSLLATLKTDRPTDFLRQAARSNGRRRRRTCDRTARAGLLATECSFLRAQKSGLNAPSIHPSIHPSILPSSVLWYISVCVCVCIYLHVRHCFSKRRRGMEFCRQLLSVHHF